MNLNASLLTAISLGLLALGLLIGAWALIAGDMQRARSDRVIGRAIRQGALSNASADAGTAGENADPRSDKELPFHWLDSRLGHALVADEDRNLIDQCGLPSKRAQLLFLIARIILTILLPIAVELFWGKGRSGADSTVAIACALAVGFMGPKWILARFAARRREQVARELPLFIDLLRLLQGVGLSLDQSLQIMASDFSHVLRVLGYELEIANRQYAQGRTREHSLQRLANLHMNENLRGLVSLLVQVDRHGGAVQEPLKVFSDRLREHRRSELKERIGKITVKMTGVMVSTLLPALVVVTAGPGFIAIFRSLGSIAK